MVIIMVMIKANVFEVKAKLSHYLERAAAGERVVICRHNQAVAELRAVDAARTEPRPVGPLPGRPRFDVPSSFFEPLSDETLAEWEGGDNAGASRSTRGRASKVAEAKARARTPRRRR
jgi:antitoxin (DNA-binding transcriptional repressor) of toxin-antitoxin stability system